MSVCAYFLSNYLLDEKGEIWYTYAEYNSWKKKQILILREKNRKLNKEQCLVHRTYQIEGLVKSNLELGLGGIIENILNMRKYSFIVPKSFNFYEKR